MFKTTLLALLAALVLLGSVRAEEVDLSALKWETNWDDPPFGDPDKAIRGGTYTDYITAYPLTFRLYGPNSNDSFAGYNRAYAQERFPLVDLHPTTERWVPNLASEWSVQDDGRTIYYRLYADAKWSDGTPITADDYTFAFEFYQSKFLVEPFYRQRMSDYFESVEKIDDHTIKIVGKNPSWRPLYDFGFSPQPKHAIQLDEEWVKRENYKPPVVAGPYVISAWKEGERVEFERLTEWWGDKHHYYRGMYNPDRIVVKVIPDTDKALDYFKKGELSQCLITTARIWATDMRFDAVQKGWAHRKRLFVETPEGIYGIIFNVKDPLLKDKNFRKALQHLTNFDELNDKLMYNAYYRQVSHFYGTKFASPNLKPYEFNPRTAREQLTLAGFTKRGTDGILTREDGTRASFTLFFGSKGLEPHLTTIQNSFKRAGVEMKLQLLDAGTAFQKGMDKAFQALVYNRTASYYPDPHQYFSCEFADVLQTNNNWGFCNEEVEKLIQVYRYGTDEDERTAAMHKIDEIVWDEAIVIPFWTGPFLRFLYWDYMEYPDFYYPKMTQQLTDYQVFWINQEKQKRLEEAMKSNTSLGEDTVVDVDPYDIQTRLEAQARTAGGGAKP